MERQAGLGRSLEDVLDSLAPIESADSPAANALFGLSPDDAGSTNRTTKENDKTKKHKNKKKQAADAKPADSKKKKKKKKKKKSKGGKQQ
jgi:hypothetical protein